MKHPPFNYHRPTTVDEALRLLDEHGAEAKILAGGQSLLPVMALRLGRPDHVIDIGGIDELGQITAGSTGGVHIGAMVRHAQAENSPEVGAAAPLVTAALPHVGHRAIRSRGTVVGSIVHADAAAEMPAVCLAGAATLHVASTQGERTVAAADFFEGFFTTAIEPQELVTAVEFPETTPGTGVAVVEVSRRHGDYAMVCLACTVQVDGGSISDAALAFFGVGSTAVRTSEAEAVLFGSPPTRQTFDAAAEAVRDQLEPNSDIHATAAYRRHIAGVLTTRGLEEAASRIGAAA